MDAGTRALERLRAEGIPAYPPGVKAGKCKAPYAVVRGGGSASRGAAGGAGLSSRTVTLYLFVPREGGDLPALVTQAKAAMRALRGQLAPTGYEGPETLEPEYDARSQTVEYRALRCEIG